MRAAACVLALALSACATVPRHETLEAFTARVCGYDGANDAWPDERGDVHVSCERGGGHVWSAPFADAGRAALAEGR